MAHVAVDDQGTPSSPVAQDGAVAIIVDPELALADWPITPGCSRAGGLHRMTKELRDVLTAVTMAISSAAMWLSLHGRRGPRRAQGVFSANFRLAMPKFLAGIGQALDTLHRE